MRPRIKGALVSLLALATLGITQIPATAAPSEPEAAPPGASAEVPNKPLPKLADSPTTKGMKARSEKQVKGLPPVPGQVTTQLAPACGTPSPGCYLYAGKDQSGMTADGAAVNLGVHNPYRLSSETGHTLTELAVRSADGQQVVEIGWTRDSLTYADDKPRIFVASWTNGTFNGYNGAGGFVNAVGCSPCTGADITAAVGSNKSFAIQHFGAPHNAFWAAYDGAWIGAWPDSLWTSPAYTQAGLIQVFGEVVSTVTSAPCTDMGNGTKTSGTGATATGFNLVNGSTGAGWTGTIQTDSNPYDVANSSGTSMEYGGPGYNSIGLNPGNTGRCAPATGMVPGTGYTCPSTFCANAEVCPDGGTTGCNNSTSWAAGALPWNCITINGGAGVEFNQGHNSSTTGKEWLVFRTSACSGSSMLMDSNGTGTWNVVMPAGWNGTAVHAYKRVA